MDDSSVSRASAAHAARLDRTIKDLQNRIKEQETALEKVCQLTLGIQLLYLIAIQLRLISRPIPTEPSAESATRLQQLRMLTTAYEFLVPKEPYFPLPDSPLPSLLALRNTHQNILDTRTALAQANADLTKAEQRLEREQANLDNANAITKSLDSRILVLNGEKQERTLKSPSQVAKDMIRELKKKKVNYEGETGRMVRSFNKFIDNHLASMLAAEELGGPVVGEVIDIDHLELESGYNSQGKVKKHKGTTDDDKRQRRIDEIWGEPTAEGRRSKESRDERHAAASEMKELTEQLLNNLVEAEAGGGDAYVVLQKESAVARFLVRAKVAQFHPKDARRLRLIDFGRDLDD